MSRICVRRRESVVVRGTPRALILDLRLVLVNLHCLQTECDCYVVVADRDRRPSDRYKTFFSCPSSSPASQKLNFLCNLQCTETLRQIDAINNINIEPLSMNTIQGLSFISNELNKYDFNYFSLWATSVQKHKYISTLES